MNYFFLQSLMCKIKKILLKICPKVTNIYYKTKNDRIKELTKLQVDIKALLVLLNEGELYKEYYNEYLETEKKIELLLLNGFEQKDLRDLYNSTPQILYTYPHWMPPLALDENGRWIPPKGYDEFEKTYLKFAAGLDQLIIIGKY